MHRTELPGEQSEQNSIPRFSTLSGVPGIRQSSFSKGSSSSLQPCSAAGCKAVSVLKLEERRGELDSLLLRVGQEAKLLVFLPP